ncbi:hypothetical protein [uncultured Algibacter sp.]|uniref:hypothetical protein n=1 Tax=uncultured Algibacter sp. TaxID=298659 RepID=UPI0026356655|nr:hypothetical protein [uncultured Algibacter sp.]
MEYFNSDLSAAVIGAIAALVANFFILILLDKRKKGNELKLLNSEIEDIQRHCKANIKVLDIISFDNGKLPSSMHFKKLKVYESSILFSPEMYRSIKVKIAKDLYRFKTEIRNVNIEIDTLLDYLNNNHKIEIAVVEEYIEYIKGKCVYIGKCASSLNTRKFKYSKNSKPANYTPRIIYEESKFL